MRFQNTIVFISVMLISACVIKPEYFDGRSVTYEHGTGNFGEIMADAIKQCSSVGKLIKHEQTACGYTCVSTFACIEKEK